MAMAGYPQQMHHPEFVSAEQHRYVLTNFRIAHEKVEEQRVQLQQQEKQVAELRARIATLEGREGGPSSGTSRSNQGGSSVDDWSIKNTASRLEKLINRWAADVVRAPPVPLSDLRDAILLDLSFSLSDSSFSLSSNASPMYAQALLRHAIAETITEGIINCLIVTSSSEANVQLTRIHEQLFARDATVACVWRRQTFSAAVETCPPALAVQIFEENMPTLARLFFPESATELPKPIADLMDNAVRFSRMVHGSAAAAGSGGSDVFYRGFVPELGSVLFPRHVELIKRCLRSEAGEVDYVGATVFPGLVKVSNGTASDATSKDMVQTVVRRAQVICACALEPRTPVESTAGSEFSGE